MDSSDPSLPNSDFSEEQCVNSDAVAFPGSTDPCLKQSEINVSCPDVHPDLPTQLNKDDPTARSPQFFQTKHMQSGDGVSTNSSEFENDGFDLRTLAPAHLTENTMADIEDIDIIPTKKFCGEIASTLHNFAALQSAPVSANTLSQEVGPSEYGGHITPLEAFTFVNNQKLLPAELTSTEDICLTHLSKLQNDGLDECVSGFPLSVDDYIGNAESVGSVPEEEFCSQVAAPVRNPDWLQSKPKLIAVAEKNFHTPKPASSEDNYLRGCLWAPDGSCILTNSRDNVLRLFNLPGSVLFSDLDQTAPEEMTAVLTMREIELVYDYTWYPLMNSSDPSTCCFASAVRRNPIRLWDAFTGTVRATYRPISHLGELISPYSVAFSSDGLRMYAGFNRFIHVFDVCRPGSDSIRRPKLGKKPLQGGMISCIAVPRDSSRQIYATGSYNGSVAMFAEPGTLLGRVQAGPAGVTQVMFSARVAKESGAPWYLVAGGRMDSRIFLWDARSLANPLMVLHRRVENHQRFQFDIDPTGQYLFTGNQTGAVCIYDLMYCQSEYYSGSCAALPGLVWRAHADSAHGLSVNPVLPLVATASGQRRIRPPVFRRRVPPASTSSGSSDDPFTDEDSEDDPANLTDDEASMLPSGDSLDQSAEPLPFTGNLTRLPRENRLALWIFPTKSDRCAATDTNLSCTE